MTLNSANFKMAITKFQPILVNFNLPPENCPECDHVSFIVGNAAIQLKADNTMVNIGSLDVSKSKDIADEYNIETFPTLLLFFEDRLIEYSGPLTEEDLVEWAKSYAPKQKQKYCDVLLKGSIDNSELALVYFGKLNDWDHIDIFLEI